MRHCRRPPLLAGLILILLLDPDLFPADVTLSWDANTETALAGYKLYYGSAPRSYSTSINVGKVTTFKVTGLGPGPFFFAVTAYDGAGSESGFSNEVSTTFAGCATSITPEGQSFSAAGGSASVSVTTTCSWTAASNVDWIRITTGATGSGNGIVTYSVPANTHASFRYGTITIAARAFSVTQAGTAFSEGCDINADGSVNALDLQVLSKVILGTASCSRVCDINRDGAVNALDLQVLSNVILGAATCP